MIASGSLLILSGVAVLLLTLLDRSKDGQDRWIFLKLFVGSMLMRWGFYLYFPYLNLWDEQFHALVAKNLAETPLHPRLYPEAPIDYNYTNWIGNYTWLHKQPWFLWQMAISIKIFGNHVWAVRLPSMIMGSLLPAMVYLLGKWHFKKDVGLFGALVAATSFVIIWLTNGIKATDHNDVAFLFYVTASFLALTQYVRRGGYSWSWAAGIGALAGIAILNKWLTGFYVFAIWGLWLLSSPIQRSMLKAWLRMFAAVATACLVFLPWQWYIHSTFPLEAGYEAALNTRHFFEVIEEQERPWHFYFSNIGLLVGLNEILRGWLLILPGLWALWHYPRQMPQLFWPWVGAIVFVFLFFSIAATKMPYFTIITIPFWWLAIGAFIAYLSTHLNQLPVRKPKYIGVALLAVLLLFNSSFFDFKRVRDLAKNPFFEGRLTNYAIYKNIDTLLPEGDRWIVFNTGEWDSTIGMFYSRRGILVYQWIPPAEELDQLIDAGYQLAVFDSEDLPDCIRQHSGIYQISKTIVKHQFF
jgi:4-amino-4-deoxy-L-arabinose transferase-like glycosyltransferase